MRNKSPNEREVALGPFGGGINELAREQDLAAGEVRDIQNMDILDSGWLRRRPGFEKVYSGTNTHSLFAFNSSYVVVDSGSLCRFNADHTTTTLVSLQDTQSRMYYAELNGELYYSNGSDTGKVKVNWGVADWAPPSPRPPVLSVLAGGGLSSGTYLVALTFVDSNGRESGPSSHMRLRVQTGQGVQVGMIEQYSEHSVRVYCSTVNGDVLYRIAEVAEGTTTYGIFSLPTLGAELEGQFLETLPGGTYLTEAHGRLMLADGNKLLWSDALNYGLYVPHKMYLPFSERISMIQPVEDGVYIGADKVYFLRGTNPKEWSLSPAQNARVTPGSGLTVRGEWFDPRLELPPEVAFWAGDLGPSVGSSNGQVISLTKDRMAGTRYQSGVSFFRERYGARQLGTAGRGQGTSTRARVGDSVSAVVVRNGVIIG